MPENPLHLLLHPSSIAVAGASNNPFKMGTLQTLALLKDGYPGRFYPVHPTEKTVLGHRAYAAPEDLPEVPDLAMLTVPTAHVVPLFEAFARLGAKRMIVISAGFRETGPEGREREEKLKAIAAEHGVRFLGPNCVGVINTALSLNLTIAAMDRKPGYLGFASQSGTYITQALPWLQARGIRFSKAVSCGNEANIDIVDALEYLGRDEQTRAIVLYIEGIRDGRRFIETAQKITPKKAVLAQYVGGSAAGARAGLSHTGAMAGPDFLYDGIFKQAGIIRCHSIEDLFAHGWVHATQPPLRGRRLAVVTNSGGPGTAISHTADQGGLTVPRFSEGLQAKIRPLILPHAASGNPVDLTFHMDTQVLAVTLPGIILQSGEVDGIVIHGAMNSGFMKHIYPHIRDYAGDDPEAALRTMAMDMAAAAAVPVRYGLPLTVSSFFGREDDSTAGYMDQDVPVFDSPEKAARGMVSLLRHLAVRERRPIERTALRGASPDACRLIAAALKSGQRALDEHQAKELLAAYGVPVVREAVAADEEEAVRAACGIGFPAALKACAWEIMHKSGRGLIALGIDSQDAVREAFRAIRAAAGSDVPVLVQEMVAGSREFVAGMTRFAGFGPCVLFGLGGVFTEALKDTAFRAAPLSATEATEMLSDIRARALLGPFRGLPAVDSAALAAILRAVGDIALNHPEIAEIDLNPLIVTGDKPVVCDALIVLAP
jgi:acetyltransferase